jgi:hypothetical protein
LTELIENSSDCLYENGIIFIAGEDEVDHEGNQMQVFAFSAIFCRKVLWNIVYAPKIVHLQLLMCVFALSIETDKERA